MTTQLNLRFSEGLLDQAKDYAQNRGFLNVQEFIRDLVREKLTEEEFEVRTEYLEKLNSVEANTFLSNSEQKAFDAQLEKQAK